MRKTLTILIGILLLSGCHKNDLELKKEFIGIWNNFPQGHYNEIQFYKDSAIFWNLCSKETATWKILNSKIHFTYIETPPDAQHDSWYVNYKMNHKRDSLTIRHEKSDVDILLLKVEDNWQHFLKGLDIQLEIPLAGPMASLTSQRNNFPDLYIGWKGKKPVIRLDDNETNISNLLALGSALHKSFAQTEYDTIHPISLIVDTNIPESVVDSIKNEIKTIYPKNLHFFRVYCHEQIQTTYGKINPDCTHSPYDWDWYGIWEE